MYIGEPGTGDDAARAAARTAGGGAARLAPHARLGHVPGVARIASKGGAAHAFWTCRGHMTSPADAWLCAALLPAFDVASTSRGWPPRDVRVAVSRASDVVAWAASQTFPVVWIVKPREGSYLSRGMHVVTMSRRDVATPAALDAWVLDRVVDRDCRRPAARRGPECDRRKNVTFQRYVHRTALVRGRKFDVRVWVLVTSVDPLRLYVLRHGYPKIASRAYTGTRDLGDQCRHVRLMLDPACVRGAGEFLANFPEGYPKSTASPVFHDGFELVRGHAPPPLPGNATATAPGARARWVDAEHFWQATVWPNVERALTAALLLARRDLLRAKAAHERADPAAAGLRRFALLAPDLAVDRRGRVYVEEINANGKIMGTHGRAGGYRDLFHDDGYVRAFLRIVGVDAHPEKERYGGAEPSPPRSTISARPPAAAARRATARTSRPPSTRRRTPARTGTACTHRRAASPRGTEARARPTPTARGGPNRRASRAPRAPSWARRRATRRCAPFSRPSTRRRSTARRRCQATAAGPRGPTGGPTRPSYIASRKLSLLRTAAAYV